MSQIKIAPSYLIASLIFFFSCTGEKNGVENQRQLVLDTKIEGMQLSQKHCQSCHLYPEPDLLDKNTWERSVLPLMGRFFGVYEENVPRSEVLKGAINKEAAQHIFPSAQLISDEDWANIVDFYVSSAPDCLAMAEPEYTEHRPLKAFEVKSISLGKDPFYTTMVKTDKESSLLYIGGTKNNYGALTILNNEFEVIDDIRLPTAPTDIWPLTNQLAVLLIGTLRLTPTNNPYGGLVYLMRGEGEKKYSSYQKFVGDLARPLQLLIEDIDGDGHDDILVGEFGYYNGGLTFYKNVDGGNEYKKRVLKDMPGATKFYLEDMNGDGFKDIVALFAQGDEHISIFYNEGQGIYREEQVLRFNPSNGSVYFELVDFNNDGFLDILYCNGDNGDYPPIQKNYHGISIFENDGKNNFKRVFFYPMHGVYKCSAADFNKNGYMDIVAVSFFPDFSSPQRKDFVFLKNLGEYNYVPKFLEENIPARWITLDIVDLDGDSYPDIILGASGTYPDNETIPTLRDFSPIVFLRNIGRQE